MVRPAFSLTRTVNSSSGRTTSGMEMTGVRWESLSVTVTG